MTVAKSLLSQIVTRHDNVLHYLYEEKSKSCEAVLSTTTVAKSLLEVALNSCRSVYIVLDGLDEYSRDDRKELTTCFKELILSLPKSDLGSIRCLFISQDDGFARKDFSMLSQIKITSANNKADIEAFCQDQHMQIQSKFGSLDKAEHNVKKVVSARAQGTLLFIRVHRLQLSHVLGMFLFAKLVTSNLLGQSSRMEFEAEIDPKTLPDGLDQA